MNITDARKEALDGKRMTAKTKHNNINYTIEWDKEKQIFCYKKGLGVWLAEYLPIDGWEEYITTATELEYLQWAYKYLKDLIINKHGICNGMPDQFKCEIGKDAPAQYTKII